MGKAMKLGFIGTGEITAAMVTGLCSSGDGHSIRLSPRNYTIAESLAHRFSTVTIASSNQDVLDDSETVVIAMRPQVVREVLSELRFRPEHQVVSVVSSFPWQAIAELVAPARRLTRAVPLPSTAKRLSPTAIYPPNHAIEDLFALLGAVYPVETEDEFDAVCAVTATIATYFAFANTTSTWLVRNGISEASARDYVARMMLGFTSAAVDAPEVGFQSLAREHATAGGINEQFLNHFLAAGLLEKVAHGLDAVKQRITVASKTP